MAETLAEDLESEIVFGIYLPGTRLTEDRIIERYGVKRHVVRQAFLQLESRGMLVHKPNRGVEVVQFTPDEVDALYEVRIILEKAAARRTELPVAATIIARLEEVAAAHAAAVEAQDFRAVFRLNQEFHRVQYSSCANERLQNLIEEHARIAQPIRVVKYDDRDHMKVVVAQHFAIIAAMRGVLPEAYVQATSEHLPASAKAFRALHERRTKTVSARAYGPVS